jgi:DNA-binding response OmpR family regulator
MAMVLIVDDAADICVLVQAFLKINGIKSDFVHSLSDATNILQTKHYSLILLDNHLPDGLGIDFIHIIRRNYPDSKIIMMSAYDDNADKQLAVSRGANLFVSKPFTREIIIDAVDNILNA